MGEKNKTYSKEFKIMVVTDYLSYIFEIATYEYCGIEDKKIPTFISKMENDYTPEISYTELKEIHQKSIQEIIKYLEKSTNNIIE